MRVVGRWAVFLALTSLGSREAHGQGVGEPAQSPAAASATPDDDGQRRPERDGGVALSPLGEEGRAPSGDSPSPPASTWYGWQTLVLDGAAGALVAASSSWGSGALVAGAVTFGLGGPLIHGAHGEGVNAGASFVLRLTLPFVGVLAGALADAGACSSPGEGTCVPTGALLGGLAGMVVASAVDAAVLGRPHHRPTVVPAATAYHRGGTVGLAGTF